MKENEICLVKEYKFDNPLTTEIDSRKDSCFKDCHNNYFHKYKYECIYDIKLANITNKERIILTLIGKNMELYELNKEITNARQRGFLLNQKITLPMKIYSSL